MILLVSSQIVYIGFFQIYFTVCNLILEIESFHGIRLGCAPVFFVRLQRLRATSAARSLIHVYPFRHTSKLES